MRMRHGMLALATTFAAGAGAPAAAPAAPYEQIVYDAQGSQVIKRYCGDQRVRLDFHDQGSLVGRITGRDGMLRYTQTHHGGATITNLATGLSFTLTWNYVNQDLRVTDNGDGTLTIITQIPGPETYYGPDGERVYIDGGTMRLLLIIDHGGTPLDPSDDTFVSETLLSSSGGPAQPTFDFCQSFRTLTG